MKRLSILSFILFIITSALYSQAVGEWRAHLAYHDAQKVIATDELIYVLSNDLSGTTSEQEIRIGSLFSYYPDDQSITTYDKVNYLNDHDIADIAYHNTLKTLIIAYKNSNIDLLIDDNDIYNISDFMNKPMMGDKTLNNIYINGDYVYLSTNFGIVIINIRRKEITNTYNLNKKVFNCLLSNNTIYAATENGVYTGDIQSNLLDINNWNLMENSKVFNNLVTYNNEIFGSISNDGLYKLNTSNNIFEIFLHGHYTYIHISNNKLIAGNTNTTVIFDQDNRTTISQDENFKDITCGKNNIYWAANGNKGLNGFKYNTENNQLDYSVQSIIPNSPIRNIFHYLTFENNKLLTVGGSLNYGGIVYPGTAMAYTDGEWINFQEDGISTETGLPYQNLTSIIEDSNDESIHYISSAGEGIYRFKNYEFDYLFSLDNSGLETIRPNSSNKLRYIRTNGLQYDNYGNLWMVNNEITNLIKVLKPNGTWTSFEIDPTKLIPTLERIMFDKRGWAWVTSMRYTPGIFCLNTNNTLEDTSDDNSKFIQTFTNQDGEVLSLDNFYSIAEDKNGTIWIGTNQGPLILNNPTKVFDEDFYCTQIKVPRNDGTSNADLLLVNEEIKAIKIDGANRKWIGTVNSGVYLLSADGLQTIHHFTVDNSPMLSDNVESIAIDPNTGIVYIGTDKGLIAYKSDATEPGNNFADDAHVYPNPVYSYYDGLITVTGLVRDSDVKIIDTYGNLIYMGTSLGGQFTWDGKNRNGKRVATGVYFVLAADSEGKEGVATKILMIK